MLLLLWFVHCSTSYQQIFVYRAAKIAVLCLYSVYRVQKESFIFQVIVSFFLQVSVCRQDYVTVHVRVRIGRPECPERSVVTKLRAGPPSRTRSPIAGRLLPTCQKSYHDRLISVTPFIHCRMPLSWNNTLSAIHIVFWPSSVHQSLANIVGHTSHVPLSLSLSPSGCNVPLSRKVV